jgi:hypothetical protein
MAANRLSPTANLLRNSRLFALPQALKPPQNAATSRTVNESDSATLPHPIRAAIETPATSLTRGDWGLKRPLPAKSTTDKSSKPVVRVNALDTFEHVTDFESAADHTMTLQKFQELHMPISLPVVSKFQHTRLNRHQSPFDPLVDNTSTSDGLRQPGALQYKQSGPWLAGQSEMEFQKYLQKVHREKPELLRKLREKYIAKRTVERRKQAQDNGEDLQGLDQPVKITEEEFHVFLKSIRADPMVMGPLLYELLDLPTSPQVPPLRIATEYFKAPPTKLSATPYALNGPPKTHPSAGLSYTRSNAILYNHPSFGPQTTQRPVEARILSPRKRFKGRISGAVLAVGGIASEDRLSHTFTERDAPAGMQYFDATIPGGAKTWVTPDRVTVDSNGKIDLASNRASESSKTPYGMADYQKPSTTNISDVTSGGPRTVPRLDASGPLNARPSFKPVMDKGDHARNLMKAISP